MTINDVGVLLKQYAGKTLEKSDVKEYIIQKKKNTTKIILAMEICIYWEHFLIGN